MAVETDRNLLFGLLRLQNGFINSSALTAAFQAWTGDKARPLAQHLQDRGDLAVPCRALLDALAEEHIRLHGRDPRREPRRAQHDRRRGRRGSGRSKTRTSRGALSTLMRHDAVMITRLRPRFPVSPRAIRRRATPLFTGRRADSGCFVHTPRGALGPSTWRSIPSLTARLPSSRSRTAMPNFPRAAPASSWRPR